MDVLQSMPEIGPRTCEHGDWSDCEVCDYDDTKPIQGIMLSEFALVMTWTRLEDGEPFWGVHTAPKQLATHTDGLLFNALYNM